jgi:hypothetical protein
MNKQSHSTFLSIRRFLALETVSSKTARGRKLQYAASVGSGQQHEKAAKVLLTT